jgi:hypothetical protein
LRGEAVKSSISKRSIVIAGHKTSVTLEDEFWKSLKEIAGERGIERAALTIGMWPMAALQNNPTTADKPAERVEVTLAPVRGGPHSNHWRIGERWMPMARLE